MKYFSYTTAPTKFFGEGYKKMAKLYWGESPLPDGAEIVVGYGNGAQVGALILLSSGKHVCGIVGAFSSVDNSAEVCF